MFSSFSLSFDPIGHDHKIPFYFIVESKLALLSPGYNNGNMKIVMSSGNGVLSTTSLKAAVHLSHRLEARIGYSFDNGKLFKYETENECQNNFFCEEQKVGIIQDKLSLSTHYVTSDALRSWEGGVNFILPHTIYYQNETSDIISYGLGWFTEVGYHPQKYNTDLLRFNAVFGFSWESIYFSEQFNEDSIIGLYVALNLSSQI